MSRNLVVPGSFNPITNAHIDMALTASSAVNADAIYFVPAHDFYVAKKKCTLIPGYCRVELINSMENRNSHNAYISALDMETNSIFPQKTYDTISKLKMAYPIDEFYICLGMDNVQTLTEWHNWKSFIEDNNFVACVRKGERLENTLKEAGLLEYKQHFLEIEISDNNISSTLVRDLCEKGQFNEVKKLVPNNVYKYLVGFYKAIHEEKKGK